MSLQELDLRPFEGSRVKNTSGRVDHSWPVHVRIFKRIVDIHFALVALPIMGVIALGLFVLNPFYNPGPVFFRQDRMGQGGVPFTIWKFRTMAPHDQTDRGHDDPLEEHRIKKLGGFLRKCGSTSCRTSSMFSAAR
jgi:lipopolysaccharide/colanic/teichoic acid biosynthesis glycosyltransferase